MGLSPLGVLLLVMLIALAGYLVVSAFPDANRLVGTTAIPTLTSPVVTPTPMAVLQSPAPTSGGDSLSPGELNDRLAHAHDLVRQSRFEEAVALYEDLARAVPNDARLEAGWAQAFLLADRPDEALSHARRAVELDPVSPETSSVLARAYLAVGDLSRALAMAQSAVELDATSAAAHVALGQVYLRAGQLEQAVEEADRALAQDPDSAEAHCLRGWLYQAVEDDLASAIAELRMALRLEPDLWFWHQELGLLQIQAQDYPAAINTLERALALGTRPVTYIGLGQAYYYLGEIERARALVEQALAAGAPRTETSPLLAAILAQEGRCDDAKAQIQDVLARDPGAALALEARAICGGSPDPPATSSTVTSVPGTPVPSPGSGVIGQPALTGRIAFPVWNTGAGEYDTYVIRPDGSDRRLVATEVSQPAFGPDGAWLAANGARDLQENLLIMRLDGSDILEITEHTEDGLPAWSLDGRRLAFSSTRHGDRQSRIYVLDNVPYDGHKAQGRVLNIGPDDARGVYPTWTSAGQILYSGCDFATTPASCGLLLMVPDPGPHTPRSVTDHPADTAPDAYGERVAFMSDRDGNWEIYVVALDGSGLARLTDSPARDILPAWSPDGRTIAFVSDEGGVWAVWAVRSDGSNRRKLFDLGGGGLGPDWQQQRISWAP